MSSLPNVIASNNLSIAHIERGNLTTGGHMLAKALAMLASSNTNTVQHGKEQGQIVNFSLDQWMTQANGTNLANDENKNEGFIYKDPIIIPTGMAYQDEVFSQLISAAIIFNLAIVHHREAHFHKAIKLYDLALQINETVALECSTVIFRMTIFYNLGVIYKCLGENINARTCFGQSLVILMRLITCGDGSASHPLCRAFLRNILIFLYSSPCGAAAA